MIFVTLFIELRAEGKGLRGSKN